MVDIPLISLDSILDERSIDEVVLIKMNIERHGVDALAGLNNHLNSVDSLIIEAYTTQITTNYG